MAETMNLENVFKGAQEVSSPGADLRLLATDSSGIPKRVSREKLRNKGARIAGDIRNAKWVRVAKVNHGKFVSFVIIAWNNYNNSRPTSLILHGYVAPSNINGCECVKVSTLANPSVFSKARMVRTETATFLDLYYSQEKFNTVTVESLTPGFSLCDSFEEATVPDGAAFKEFALAESGGVISCTSVRKGGGLRDGGDDESYRGDPAFGIAEHPAVQEGCHRLKPDGLQRLHSERVLLLRRAGSYGCRERTAGNEVCRTPDRDSHSIVDGLSDIYSSVGAVLAILSFQMVWNMERMAKGGGSTMYVTAGKEVAA